MATEAEPMIPPPTPPQTETSTKKGKIPWIPLAAASGACAAFNGVFAKLTTTELTSSWASAISTSLQLSSPNKVVEFLIRAVHLPLNLILPIQLTYMPGKQVFFSLNLAFNALMWALFTSALTRASSTTRVSIINTSANFMLTAFSGWIVFGEKLPGLWWVGASGLVVGNVVIGRRDEEGDNPVEKKGNPETGGEEERREGYRDVDDTNGISDGIELAGERGRGDDNVQR